MLANDQGSFEHAIVERKLFNQTSKEDIRHQRHRDLCRFCARAMVETANVGRFSSGEECHEGGELRNCDKKRHTLVTAEYHECAERMDWSWISAAEPQGTPFNRFNLMWADKFCHQRHREDVFCVRAMVGLANCLHVFSS
jgi:hypothetical protein